TETAVGVGGPRATQSGDAARSRITGGARLAPNVLQLLDDVPGGRQIRIAHTQVDDVPTPVAGLSLLLFFLVEHVGRQTANAVAVFQRLRPSKDAFPRRPPRFSPAGFYHGFGLAPSVWLFWASLGGFFALGAVFFAVGGRPSWLSRTLINSF